MPRSLQAKNYKNGVPVKKKHGLQKLAQNLLVKVEKSLPRISRLKALCMKF